MQPAPEPEERFKYPCSHHLIMRQWRVYEKTYRLRTPKYDIAGKFVLSPKEARELLRGDVVVTEKMDGANAGVFIFEKNFYLQKRRGHADGSHEQFKLFRNKWYWEHYEALSKIDRNVVIYGELMYCTHSIYYDRLPDFFLVFDVYDLDAEKYMDWDGVLAVASAAGLATVPCIGHLHNPTVADVERLVPSRSAYGDTSEGIVIKNYKRGLRGKIVKPEFIKQLEESDHWANSRVRYNRKA
jgi:ATP-dependent RNA circularization protein (DNA/RNA ligase family)